MDIFQQVTRQAIRFQTPKGELNVEQLWSLNLDMLEAYEASLIEELEKFGKSTRRKTTTPTAVQQKLELQLACVTSILDTRFKELADKQALQAKKERNAEIMALIAKKKAEELSQKSIAELESYLVD